jgi:hypothetical protein
MYTDWTQYQGEELILEQVLHKEIIKIPINQVSKFILQS